MRTHHALAAILVAALAGTACTPEGPTEPEAQVRSGAVTDGGVMYGSGNPAAANETETAADSSGATTAERGGVMYGSGN